jgi:ATP-dependent helicase/nuclease subunit A
MKMETKTEAVMQSKLLDRLDGDQRAAVVSSRNTVVTAGAGSGKTLVLASRYVWLIMEKGLKTDEILTLTFTNKAANEMYGRIYSMLMAHRDHERVKEALKDFHQAGISTLDSFCAAIARTAAGRYGISPDFILDADGVRELAMKEALPFALEHRGDAAVRVLMAENKIREVAEELFAGAALRLASISSPADFAGFKKKQGEHILSRWKETSGRVRELLEGLREETARLGDSKTKTAENFRQIMYKPSPPLPDMEALMDALGFFEEHEADGARAEKIKKDATRYFGFLSEIRKLRAVDSRSAALAGLKEYHDELKGALGGELDSIAAYILQADISAGIFSLLEVFQRRFNGKKRTAGILSFNDVSRLAVDALLTHRDIRKVYQEKVFSVMIDEFQDNNSLQKNLIFLIASKPGKTGDAGQEEPPGLKDLHEDRMFFVGDEKQSIYRFRGADVSVFRKLGGELSQVSSGETLVLSHNYRSVPGLVDAFNWIFGGLLPGRPPAEVVPAGEGVFSPESAGSDWEASYVRALAGAGDGGGEGGEPALRFCFLDKDEIDQSDPFRLSSFDLEAAFIAEKIRAMVEGREEIHTRDGSRPCGYRDFAVLQRSASHQGELERQFRNFGVPYSADDPAGLFNDAPINDLYYFLRLMVYPDDREAYAAVLRSPLTGLSDRALALCLLSGGQLPFEELPPGSLPEEEMKRYRESGAFYRSMVEEGRTLGSAEILSRLWYETGYRCETLWSSSSQIYAELFDFFFELARKSDGRGKTLADFLDYFDEVIKSGEKIRDLSVPVENKAGVRIMTIHKSKGLEFPVVFLWGAGSKNAHNAGRAIVYYSDEWGCAVNLPRAEELPGDVRGNYFYNLRQQEELRMETAELRRLLYVAMTRAESRLFVTAALPPRLKGDKERGPPPGGMEERLLELREKPKTGKSLPSFLELLLPPLTSPEKPGSLFTLESIPVLSREELALKRRGGGERPLTMAEAAQKALPLYSAAPLIGKGKLLPASVPASSLRFNAGGGAHSGAHSGAYGGAEAAAESRDDGITRILEKAGLGAEDFGTIAHAFLEARLNGQVPAVPSRMLARFREGGLEAIRKEALSMADRFLSSELGKKSAAAARRESEFPFVTAVKTRDRTVAVTGQIDLLFEEGEILHVVDFKTDRIENPGDHYGQLAVYKRAAEDIFGKPVRAWLYYLRSGHAVELPLEDVSIEELVSALPGGV